MYPEINNLINTFAVGQIPPGRLDVLRPLTNYIQQKKDTGETIRLNFICTHNSRRSHLSQIWAQTMAFYFNINHVYCYSGGTEATAMFPKVAETLGNQGFFIQKLSNTENPVYAVKYNSDEHPVICFSKTYDNEFNPGHHYAAIMTCSQADEGCPIVFGAEYRFPIRYDDPKVFDGTDVQNQKYAERSLEIAREMWWVFHSIV